MEGKFLYRVLSDEQMLELWIRQGVEERFERLLQYKVADEELRALKNLFFRFLYRTEFGERLRGR